MLQIENRNGGYLLKEKGGPVKVVCADRERLHNAIDHYYGDAAHDRENCPLCAQMKAELKAAKSA